MQHRFLVAGGYYDNDDIAKIVETSDACGFPERTGIVRRHRIGDGPQ